LQSKGVIIADKFEFDCEYQIQLDNLPLVPVNINFGNIDGLFTQLAEIKVITSILSACLRHQSELFVSNQVEELKQHYLEYIDLQLSIKKTEDRLSKNIQDKSDWRTIFWLLLASLLYSWHSDSDLFLDYWLLGFFLLVYNIYKIYSLLEEGKAIIDEYYSHLTEQDKIVYTMQQTITELEK
jgi:hypothetical protein